MAPVSLCVMLAWRLTTFSFAQKRPISLLISKQLKKFTKNTNWADITRINIAKHFRVKNYRDVLFFNFDSHYSSAAALANGNVGKVIELHRGNQLQYIYIYSLPNHFTRFLNESCFRTKINFPLRHWAASYLHFVDVLERREEKVGRSRDGPIVPCNG